MTALPEAQEHGSAPAQPHDAAAAGAAPASHRDRWKWVCAALGVVAVGLLIWALHTRYELDSAQQDAAALEAQAEGAKETGGKVVAAFKGVVGDLQQQLGSTSEDLAATEQDLGNTQADAAKAQQDAAAADQRAADAKRETDKAQAEVDAAEAKAKAAEADAAVATDCVKSYVSALGGLFNGGGVSQQVPAVKQEIERISAGCQGVLGG